MSHSTPPRRLDLPGALIMVVCCAFWGGNAVAVKFATPDIPPFGVAGFRFLLSLPILAVVCRLSGQPMWVRREHWPLLLGHALITVLQIGTFNLGTSHSAAGRSSIFINVHPLIVAPLAWMLLGERMGGLGILGLGSAAAGVGLVLSSSFGGGDTYLGGDLVVLASGIIFAVQTVLQKMTFSRIAPATLLWNQSLLAIPLFFLYSGTFEGFENYHFSMQVVLALIYQGIAVSGFCFSVWLLLLGRYPAAQLATVAFVTPMFGVAAGHWLKQEPLSLQLVLGGVLVGVGIYMTASDRAEHVPTDEVMLPGDDAP
ncbi:MAG: protein of unknown function transrane [Planctomycetota bacterium]|nr:protein of unknown function transrane [Planctomycetota bacterium]